MHGGDRVFGRGRERERVPREGGELRNVHEEVLPSSVERARRGRGGGRLGKEEEEEEEARTE